jgi:hypothetical protein
MNCSRRRLLGVAGATATVGVGGYVLGGGTDSVLRFSGEVGPDVRRRCRRAERRFAEIVGRAVDEPVTVRFAPRKALSPSRSRERFDDVVAAATLVDGVEWPTGLPPRLGYYDSSTRTISFLDLDSVDTSTLEERDDVTLPDGDWFPHDPLIVHELTHALQDELVDTISPADGTRDATAAARTVVEGTADYVAGRYRAACRDGRYEACQLGPRIRFGPEPPLFVLAANRHRYVNGRLFAHDVVRQSGWNAVWRAHRNPPATTAAATYPEQYHDTDREPVVPERAATGENWLHIGSDRLGVEALYTMLYALEQVSLDDDAARVADEVTDATTYRYAFRSSLLRDWLGDHLAGYGFVDDLDRFGVEWSSVWRTSGAAERFATTVRDGFTETGRRVDDGWRLDDRVVRLERNETAVSIRMVPDAAAAGNVFEPGDHAMDVTGRSRHSPIRDCTSLLDGRQ